MKVYYAETSLKNKEKNRDAGDKGNFVDIN
jgi:hypothetical protein